MKKHNRICQDCGQEVPPLTAKEIRRLSNVQKYWYLKGMADAEKLLDDKKKKELK